MPLNDQDRAWIREAIREANKPTIAKIFKDWIPAAAVVALLVFAWTKNSDYSEFRGSTDARLKALETTLARQNLTASASLSPEAFASNLPQLEADVKVAKEKNVSISSGVLKDISQRLLTVSNSASGYWPAAVQFVDYKFLPRPDSASLPNCLSSPPTLLPQFEEIHNPDGSTTQVPGTPLQAGHWAAEMLLSNCVLNLDDDGNFQATAIARAFEARKNSDPRIDQYILVLNGVLAKYSGGPLLRVSKIRFTNCWFELPSPTQTPSKPTQTITTQLLEADRYQGKVDLQPGA